jgi:hypothetical protein
MALETGSFISDLNTSNPQSTDSVSQADDHIRLIKSTVKATFPNITGAVTKTHTQLNNTLDKTGDTMTGALTLSGAPSSNLHAATKLYVDTADATKIDATRTITAGTGLSGGGDLSANRTLSIASGGVGTTQLADAGVTTAKIADAAITVAKLAEPLTIATAQATTSGTTKDFNDIPSWASRITVVFNNVSLTSNGDIAVQIGDSGGIENTGYTSSCTNSFSGTTLTSGYLVRMSNSAFAMSGTVTLHNISGNIWVASVAGCTNNATYAGVIGGGVKELSATLDRLRVLSVDGTGTFDSGSVNIFYE